MSFPGQLVIDVNAFTGVQVDPPTRQQLRAEARRQTGLSSSGGFASAEDSRDAANWLKSNLDPQSNIELSRREMLERGDSAVKNYELGTAHVEGRVTRVVGCGTTLDPAIKAAGGISKQQAEAWNEALRDAWDRQVMRIGRHRESLRKVQALMERHRERHGEWFVLIGDKFDPLNPTSLRVEVIHPKRVETPPDKSGNPFVRMGMQLNEDGDVIGCYVRDSHPGETLGAKHTHTFYPMQLPNGMPRMVHHFDPKEAGELRGYPQAQVGFKRLKNSEDYAESELERNYGASCITPTIRTDLDLYGEDGTPAGVVEDGKGRRVMEMTPGMVTYVGMADEIIHHNPGGAPQSFDPFMQYEARMYAVGAGTSYEMLTRDFRGMTLATLRVVLDAEHNVCDVKHKDHEETLLAIWMNFVSRMVTSPLSELDIDQLDYRSRPWVYWRVQFIQTPRQSVSPAQDDRNDLTLAEAGVQPAGDMVTRKTGRRPSEQYERVQRDRELRKQYGLEQHMPQMGRSEDGEVDANRSPSRPGDQNPESSDANQPELIQNA